VQYNECGQDNACEPANGPEKAVAKARQGGRSGHRRLVNCAKYALDAIE
jgi:hypothetical protein